MRTHTHTHPPPSPALYTQTLSVFNVSSLPGWYHLSFRDNVSDVSIPSPVPMHSPHWHRYNGLGDRTNDIPPPPTHSASVLLSKTWLCVTLYALASATSLDPFTTVSDSIDIHPQACASLPTSVLLFFTPLIYHRWRGHDGVIDPWKARCPPDGGGGGGGGVVFGNQTALLSYSRAARPLIRNQASYYL